MALKRTMPNLGDGNTEYVHCPNCSKMYRVVDADGNSDTLPANCKRCGCPVEDSPKALKFMDDFAKANHDPALSAMGKRSRGELVIVDV